MVNIKDTSRLALTTKDTNRIIYRHRVYGGHMYPLSNCVLPLPLSRFSFFVNKIRDVYVVPV